ncbi:MAG: PrsW family glutamic-type intramembrane protease [Flavobacteriaceae bacterium]
MIHIILNFLGFLLIIIWFKNQATDYKSFSKKKEYFKLSRFKSILISILVVALPLILVNYTAIEDVNHISDISFNKNRTIFAFMVSVFITLVWLIYIYRLDIFNKEKKRHIFIVIFFALITTSFAQYPYEFIHQMGFTNTQNPIGSFIYSVFGIGLIEETIKLIPLLLILKFTKAIDEPYDFILYASVSALGFSLVENTMYLERNGIEIINARAIYATVAHMTFSSMIGYGLYLIRFKKTNYSSFLVFLVFFFFAIFSHGFYDFWLINKSVARFSGLTTLFFLFTIHIWFTLKNNTLNASNYYDDRKKINNDRLKIYLIVSLLSIFMLSYIYVAFKWNSQEANLFFVKSTIVYGYIIFYLIATLSKFNLVKGIVKPIKFNFDFLYKKFKQ